MKVLFAEITLEPFLFLVDVFCGRFSFSHLEVSSGSLVYLMFCSCGHSEAQFYSPVSLQRGFICMTLSNLNHSPVR